MNHDDRFQVLRMVESGQISAAEGDQLLEAIEQRTEARLSARTLRIKVVDLGRQRTKIDVRVPISLVEIGLRLGARLAPRISAAQLNALVRAADRGATGRIFEVQDLDEAEHVEVFIE